MLTKEKFIDSLIWTLNNIKEDKNENLNDTILEIIQMGQYRLSEGESFKYDALEKLDSYMIDFDSSKTFETVYDLTNDVMADNQANGSLLYNSWIAQQELIANYSIDEIIDMKKEYEPREISIEELHLNCVIDKMNDILQEKYSELEEKYPNADYNDIVIASVYQTLVDNNYSGYQKGLDDAISKLEKENDINLD